MQAAPRAWPINVQIPGSTVPSEGHEPRHIDNIAIVKNFLITGSLITFFGFLSAYSSIFNLFSYYYFGLNKRAMTEISSISGNTWRGLAPSAESIGEFFAYSIFIFLFYVYKKQIKITWLYAIFLLINIIGNKAMTEPITKIITNPNNVKS